MTRGQKTAIMPACEIACANTPAKMKRLELFAARRAGFNMARPWHRRPQTADYIILEQEGPCSALDE